MCLILWLIITIASSLFWYDVGRKENVEMAHMVDTNAKICEAQIAINLAHSNREWAKTANRMREEAVVAIYQE